MRCRVSILLTATIVCTAALTEPAGTLASPADAEAGTTTQHSSSLGQPYPPHPWQQFGGSAAHSGVAAAPGPLSWPVVRWRTVLNTTTPAGDVEEIYGSAAVSADGVVYVSALYGCTFAFYASSGAPAWPQAVCAGEQVLASPALSGDGSVVYVADTGGVLRALSARSGSEVWQYTAPGQIRGSPAVSPGLDGRVFVTSSDGTVTAVEATGLLAWAVGTNSTAALVSTPALPSDGSTVYIAGDGELLALRAADGAVAWRQAAGIARGIPPNKWWQILSSPAVSPDNAAVYVGSWNGSVLAYRAADGVPLWRFDVAASLGSPPSAMVIATPALGGGRLFAGLAFEDANIGVAHGRLFALDAGSGALAWATPLNAVLTAGMSLGSDGASVFVGVYDGDGLGAGGVAAFDAATGVQGWSLPLGDGVYGAPAVGADGALFVGTTAAAFFVLAPPPPGPSPLPSGGGAGAAPMGGAVVIALAACGGIAAGTLALGVAWLLCARARAAAAAGKDRGPDFAAIELSYAALN